jgi:hypothetical protein
VGEAFAPLSQEERKRGTRRANNTAVWRVLQPVPEHAPPPPREHPTLGACVAAWRYADAQGRTLAFEYRFLVNGEKQTRPLTYCEHAKTRLRAWRWKAPDAPRPLYGLDRLEKRLTAPVLVCEGPKASDAAQALFPDQVAVALMGGADAAAYADLTPLAGRRVFVWPDADEPGRAFARDVARLALETGAVSVRVVPVPETFPDGWDLADAPPEGCAVARLHELLAAAEHFVPALPEPESAVRFPFRLTPESVDYAEERDGEREWVRVASRLEVVAVTSTEASTDHGRLLRWTDCNGVTHEWPMPMALLASDGAEYRAQLLSLGVEIAPGHRTRERLHEYLLTTKPAARVRCVSRVGWHGPSFVLPDATFGGGPVTRTLLQSVSAMEHAFRVSGSLEG